MKHKNKWTREWNIVELFFLTWNDLSEVNWRIMFRKMRTMSEIIQANCSWSKISRETDLGRNVWTQDNSSQDNSPLTKLILKQLAPDSETNSPHVVILHNVLKYAGKIINILKFYSPQLDINRLRDDSHKNQFLLGRFDWDGSHKISNGTVRTTLLGRFAQNLIYLDNSPVLI